MRDDRLTDNRGGPMLVACKLFPRTSGKGTPYLLGRLGGLRVLIMPRRQDEADKHTHVLMLAEAPQHGGEQ
jgi:hypothetical protein